MICQHCGKAPATTRMKCIRNGALSEIALCSDCARKLGYSGFFSDWSLPLSSLLGGLMEEEEAEEVRCENCGTTFDEIVRTGRVGCAQCYQTFLQRLSPMIQRIHGSTGHRGKSPLRAELTVRPQVGMQVLQENDRLLKEKERQLQQAVEEQKFELAAVIRDEIKAIREGNRHE